MYMQKTDLLRIYDLRFKYIHSIKNENLAIAVYKTTVTRAIMNKGILYIMESMNEIHRP